MAGFVYLATNKYMPGIVKIGCTMRLPRGRVDELGFRCPVGVFDLVSSFEVQDDHFYIEGLIHKIFEKSCVEGSKDYFEVDLDRALAVFELASVLARNPSVQGSGGWIDLPAAPDRYSKKGQVFKEIMLVLDRDGIIPSMGWIADNVNLSLTQVSRWTDEWAYKGKLIKERRGQSVALYPIGHKKTSEAEASEVLY